MEMNPNIKNWDVQERCDSKHHISKIASLDPTRHIKDHMLTWVFKKTGEFSKFERSTNLHKSAKNVSMPTKSRKLVYKPKEIKKKERNST